MIFHKDTNFEACISKYPHLCILWLKIHDMTKIFKHKMYDFTCEIQRFEEHSLFSVRMMKYKFHLYLPATQHDGKKYKKYHVST
jgi:hypothetical protein